MRFVLASARKDLLLILRDPAGLVTALGIPVLLITMLTLFFGGEKITPKGKLLIVDEDKSLASSFLAGAFTQGELGEMIQVEKVGEDEGRRRIQEGDGSALLVIPKGFGSDFLNRRPTRLQLVKNPSQRILPGIVEEVLSVMTDAAFYLQTIFHDALPEVDKRPTDQQIADVSVRMRRMGETISGYVNPPLIKLETAVSEKKAGRRVPIGVVFFPGLLFLALMFTGQGIATDIWTERTQRALYRVAASPSGLAQWLGGKAVAAAVFFTVVVASSFAAGRAALGMHVANPLAAMAWCILSAVCFYLFLACLQFYASSARAAGVLSNLVVLPLALVGGSLMPLEFLPESVGRIARMTPNGAALAQLRAMMDGPVDGKAVLLAAAALAAMGALAFAASLVALRRGFAVGR